MQNQTSVTIQELPNSEVEFSGEFPVDDFERYRPRALLNLQTSSNFPGFRKGHVPKDVIISKIGDVGVLEEMAEIALSEAYPEMLRTHGVDALGRPIITLTKLATGNPLGFKIRTAVMPKITLPDYLAIAMEERKKKEIIGVTDLEVENALQELRKLRAGWKPGEENPGVDESSLPAINDEFAKSVGKYQTLDELKVKIRENIQAEKDRRGKEKTRVRILGAIITKTNGEIPNILVQNELHTLMAQLKADIADMGMNFEQYLSHAKKTEEELRMDLSPRAIERVKGNLILQKIATEKSISPSPEAIAEQTKHLLDHYHDADPERTRAYVETVLTNEKVFEMLENE